MMSSIRAATLAGAGIAALLAAAWLGGCSNARTSYAKESHRMTEKKSSDTGTVPAGREQAMFAAGCFWGVESTFRAVEGVTATSVGYSGGHTENPTYEEVCGHGTGHAETVRVVFDPVKASYEKLLDVFWGCHNPTTLNRQGPDVGSQYRSAIFYLTDEQKSAAEKSKAALAASGKHSRPIVTEITPAGKFWMAEDYHQQYHEKHGGGSCPTTIE